MLKFYYGKDYDKIQIPGYFDNNYMDEWFYEDLTKRIVKEIDNSEVVGPHLIQSPVLGAISPKDLSGGAKGLILMAFDPDLRDVKRWHGAQFGDNCWRMMMEIAANRDYDIRVQLTDFIHPPKGEFIAPVMSENDGTLMHNYDEYYEHYFSYDMQTINLWDQNHPRD